MFKKYKFTWLNSGLNSILSGSLHTTNYFTALLRKSWHIIVGEAMAAHSSPSGVYNKVLNVYVDDPSWIQEFTLYRDEIRDKVKLFFSDKELAGAFNSIRFLNGEVPKGPGPVKPGGRGKIDPETMAQIEKSVSKIDDKELKDALKHYLVQSQLKFR
ncbi:MAG: DUF721 domain-containing protein [Brevinematales bacterium]|jgi:hypothetical protein